MKELYIAVHHHEYGSSVYVVSSSVFPSEEELVKLLDIDFEEHKGEFIDIMNYPSEDIIDLDELRTKKEV